MTGKDCRSPGVFLCGKGRYEVITPSPGIPWKIVADDRRYAACLRSRVRGLRREGPGQSGTMPISMATRSPSPESTSTGARTRRRHGATPRSASEAMRASRTAPARALPKASRSLVRDRLRGDHPLGQVVVRGKVVERLFSRRVLACGRRSGAPRLPGEFPRLGPRSTDPARGSIPTAGRRRRTRPGE